MHERNGRLPWHAPSSVDHHCPTPSFPVGVVFHGFQIGHLSVPVDFQDLPGGNGKKGMDPENVLQKWGGGRKSTAAPRRAPPLS